MTEDWEDEMEWATRNYVEFKCVQFNEKGERIATISRYVRGEDSEYLGNLLTEFAFFLNGMTYSYIAGVKAIDKDGEEIFCSQL